MSGLPLKSDGSVPIRTGTPGSGQVLTSDANGFFSWASPSGGSMSSWSLAASGTGGSESITDGETVTFSGSGIVSVTRSTNTITISASSSADNLGNHTATTTLDMSGQNISNCTALWFGSVGSSASIDLFSTGVNIQGTSATTIAQFLTTTTTFFCDFSVSGIATFDSTDIDFSAPLDMNLNYIANCADLNLENRSTDPGNNNTVYVKSGQLWFKRNDGTTVQLS